MHFKQSAITTTYADDDTVEARKAWITNYCLKHQLVLNSNTKFVILVQNKCIEIWFLGNSKIYKKNPQQKELLEYLNYYNVKTADPELMEKPSDYNNSIGAFHEDYLSAYLLERNIAYSKNNPRGVVEESYLEQLILRNQKTNHLASFKEFIDFCTSVKQKINSF